MSKEFSAKTVEEAVSLGLSQLGLTLETAEYVVIEQPSKGFLGMGAKPAKISMSKKKTDADRASDFLDGIFEMLKITATSDIVCDNNDRIEINLVATDSSPLIGYRGEVLDALQTLAGAVANKNNEKYKRVVVDCENYRSKREQTLISLAEKLATKAIKTSRKITLEPMNPCERRVIHSALVNFEGVKTASEGKEPARYVVIIPDNYDPSKSERKPFGRGKKFDRDGRRSSRDDRRDRLPRSSEPKAKKTGFGGGIFLGNSQKDNKDE